MIDDLRTYLQMASGLTEATTAKARDAIGGLISTGMALTNKAPGPAPEMMGQVAELADDLVATSKTNRDMLTGMIRAEVDKAVGRMGFVREDELAAVRRHVNKLELQVDHLSEELAAAQASAAAHPAADQTSDTVEEAAVAAELTDGATAESAAPKKKKKKILVDPEAQA